MFKNISLIIATDLRELVVQQYYIELQLEKVWNIKLFGELHCTSLKNSTAPWCEVVDSLLTATSNPLGCLP